MQNLFRPAAFCLFLFTAFILYGQENISEDIPENISENIPEDNDSFGFGNEGFGFGGAGATEAGKPAVKIGGEVSAELKAFPNESSDMQMGDIFSGKLNLAASASVAEGVINLKLRPVFDGTSPVLIDEAYVRAFFGPVDVEGGFRKLSWGKADSFGPLDVINPIDYSDLSAMGDPRSIKIARPLLHVTWNMGSSVGNRDSFSKLEGVFVPWFKGNEYAMEGRWAPSQISKLQSAIPGSVQLQFADFYPKTNTIQYAQAGLRYTVTIGSSDLGFQYYYGRLPRPFYNIRQDKFLLTGNPKDIIDIGYNEYHQIGTDFARVIGGFNVRAEAGANITSDLSGDEGSVYNPAIVWSLGFDRDMVWGINLNLQGNGSIRLMHNKIGNDPMTDTEAEADMTSTRITAILSKKFFQDELELKTTALWGIEDRDFLVMPAVIWSRNDIRAEVSAGFFGGDRDGELGQYRKNHFVKTVLTYTF
jgi:hypothetical protein